MRTDLAEVRRQVHDAVVLTKEHGDAMEQSLKVLNGLSELVTQGLFNQQQQQPDATVPVSQQHPSEAGIERQQQALITQNMNSAVAELSSKRDDDGIIDIALSLRSEREFCDLTTASVCAMLPVVMGRVEHLIRHGSQEELCALPPSSSSLRMSAAGSASSRSPAGTLRTCGVVWTLLFVTGGSS